MNNVCLIINTITNVFALPPILNSFIKGYRIGGTITLCSFIASLLMHISETKHHLQPFVLSEYSDILLNIDRFFMLLTFLYGWGLTSNLRNHPQFWLFLFKGYIGLVSFKVGELTDNLLLYTVSHTFWHYCIYDTLNKIILLQ